jgi:hypothetical protein
MRLALTDLSATVAYCDPAGRPKSRAELKRIRARTAIVVLACDDLGRVYVLDAWAMRASTEVVTSRIFATQVQWNCIRFGIEANAMQELYAGMLRLEAKRRGATLPLIEVHQPTNIDKLWRIRTALQPLLARGQLVIREDLVEFLTELRSFPTGRTIDLVDACASAVELLPKRNVAACPAGITERQQLADYLRRSGVDQSLINLRLAKYDRAMTAGRPLVAAAVRGTAP